MRVPLSWLRDYVDVDLAPEALAERLTLLGMEVKGIERWGADWRNVVVGELLSVEKHPRADRLSLTTASASATASRSTIVCGATNIAAGQRVPVALPGAVLPGDRRIERTEKMGVVSNGMLCSGDELNLTGDADGILILPPDAPIGDRRSTELYGDVVLDVDVKPNRGDALSLIGLAREVAAITGATAPLARTPIRVEDERDVDERLLAVEVRDAGLCPRFVGRWVDGVDGRAVAGPRPDAPAGRRRQRPISNVVDVSNYVMLELGKPIHTYDADGGRGARRAAPARSSGGPTPASASRRSTTSSATLDPDTLLIADDRGPLGIAGIMGGAASEVARRDDRGDRRVGDLRPDRHPPDRPALRPPVRGEPPVREGPGVPARPDRRRPRGPAHRRVGRRIGRPRRASTRPRTSPDRTRVAFRPARVNRLLGTDLAGRRAARPPRPRRRSRPSHRRGRRPARSTSRRPEAARRSTRPRTTRSSRSSRRGAATSRSRPTSPRRSPAFAATTRSRRSCRTRRCRASAPSPLERPRRASARRWPGPA